jgi:predicted CXXCH cytochrome family protein
MTNGHWFKRCKAALIRACAVWSLAVIGFPTFGQPAPQLSPAETLLALRAAGRVESGQKFFAGAKPVGSETCKSCHARQYEEWAATWHAKMERLPSPDTIVGDFNDRVIVYKDTRVRTKEGKEARISPSVVTSRKGDKFVFTLIDSDNPANNQTYEVAKVLGGKWDQHYEIKLGDNYLPAPIRWSVAARDWLVGSYRPYDWFEYDGTPDGRPRKPEELPLGQVAEAKCSGCHTTGFNFVKDKQTNVWKATGSGELGIACEQCHGPASKHIEEANAASAKGERIKPGASTIVHPLKDLTAMQQTQVCAQCHGRNTNKTISELSFQVGFLPGDINMTSRARFWSYSGTSNPDEYNYFWPNDWAARNRQQWQDFTRSKHFSKGMSCLTCHTFHGKWEDAQLRQPPQALCAGCHSGDGYAKRPNAEMFMDSPMHKAGVRCVDCHMPMIGYRSERTSKGPHPWDVSSHTFMVATPALEKSQGIRSSCAQCHEGQGAKLANGVQAPPFNTDVLHALLTQRQTDTRNGISEVQKILAGVKSRKPEAKALVGQANAKLDFVLLDGSLGMHNQERSLQLLADARKLAVSASRIW